MNRKNEILCAYCGKLVNKKYIDKEHVFPRCLYPLSKANSKVQRLTIPACKECNHSWSDDEVHFRNVLAIAGEPNEPRRELWDTEILHSFNEADGLRRKNDLVVKLKPVITGNRQGHKIYPGEDERVIRVVRKIIKGLSYHHKVMSPVSDERIWVDVLKYPIYQDFLDLMEYHHREQDIVEYRYQVLIDNEYDIHSVWLIRFYQKVTFIGIISMSENGMEKG